MGRNVFCLTVLLVALGVIAEGAPGAQCHRAAGFFEASDTFRGRVVIALAPGSGSVSTLVASSGVDWLSSIETGPRMTSVDTGIALAADLFALDGAD